MAELFPLLILALAFIVLVVLPMRTRARALQKTRELQAGLTVGTEVMTTSGLYGRITEIAEETVDLEISPGVVVRWAKLAIAETREPVSPVVEPSRVEGEPGQA